MKGTTYDKRRNKWHSKISVRGKTLGLGVFDTQLEAHEAYLAASIKYAALRVRRAPKYRASTIPWHI